MLINAPVGAKIISYDNFRRSPVETLEAMGFLLTSPDAKAELQRFIRAPHPNYQASELLKATIPAHLRALDSLLATAHGTSLDLTEMPVLKGAERERSHRKHFTGGTLSDRRDCDNYGLFATTEAAHGGVALPHL